MQTDIPSRAAVGAAAWQRPTAAVLAGTCALLLLGGVVRPFHGASQLAWLAPTLANTAAVDACHALRRADAQRLCLEQAVATALSRQSTATQFALAPAMPTTEVR